MKASLVFCAAVGAVVLLLPQWQGIAADPVPTSTVNCDSVAKAVQEAVEKDPKKVLAIVEDFMVSNQSCASAIVTAAILASHANADLAKQIAVTATHVAPDMGPMIAAAVEKLLPSQAAEVAAATQKEEQATDTGTGTTASTETADTNSDNATLPMDLRGIYFTQPSASGSFASNQTPSTSGNNSKETKKATVHVVTHTVTSSTPNGPSPASPSSAAP